METTATEIYRLPVTIRKVGDIDRSGRWLLQGWRDFLAKPGISLAYGGAFVVISLALTLGLYRLGLTSLILPLAGGFAIIAPILVVGLYEVSRRREQGLEVTLGDVVNAYRAHAGQLSAMGLILMICYLIWVEIALVLFMAMFHLSPPSLEVFFEDVLFSINGAILLAVGTAIGAVFGAVVFSISAVSVPLIFDRPVDVVTAVSTSLLTVRGNWRLMFGWAALIVVVIACAFLTAFIGLAVALPVLAYATWHCYRDMIDTSAPSVPYRRDVAA